MTVRGRCLCGDVAWEAAPPLEFLHHCHCGRYRKAHGAAWATAALCEASGFRVTLTRADGVRPLDGEPLLAAYQVPEARWFTAVFCRRCGAKAPRIDRERDLAIVPMGALDDDPGIRPQCHIFVGSKASWDEITDDPPRHEAARPAR